MPVPSETAPIGRQRAREIVIERLRHWIVEGMLAPGEVIKDGEIAATLGVSRTPVREALLQLEREGLIESMPGRWTRVTLVDVSHAERLYPVICALESLSARMAAEHAIEQPNLLAGIEAAQREFAIAVDRYASAPSADAINAVREADDRFHAAILQAAMNPFLEDSLLPLKVLTRRFENLYFGSTSNIGAASVQEHERLIRALRAGNAQAAADIAWHNFERTIEFFRESSQASGGPHPPARHPEGTRPNSGRGGA